MAWPRKPISPSPTSSARIALEIGSAIATAVPNTAIRTRIATSTPMRSLVAVSGVESCEPRYPPADTSIPAADAGFVLAKMPSASSVLRFPELRLRKTEMKASLPSGVIAPAPERRAG